ncbi:DinB family protein [Terriglobus sp. TAA 43]|uniref:DinB family protein n=1 Tax=Terriglobus sp. TAA 43 TaxID=278961 RepID=UPI0006460721|nr:hypothetical protein [Terriglobus sp. TAA 43]
MKVAKQIIVAVFLACISTATTVAHAQQSASKPTPGTLVSPAEALNALMDMTESQMISLVKSFPADKYGFAPGPAIFAPNQKTDYAGVRTFGALVLHVAQANYILGSRVSGLKPDVDPAKLPRLSSKDEIVAALEASFAFDHKVIGTITAANAFESTSGSFTRATQAAFIVVHASDEYGQMVEYLRMNGIAPPSSGAPAPPRQ